MFSGTSPLDLPLVPDSLSAAADGAAMACRDGSGLWTGKKAELCALLGLVAVSAIGAASSARFYTHYYIPLIPPLALLAAPFYARLWFGRTHTRRILFSPALSYAWLALTVVVFSSAHFLTLASQHEPSETGRYLAEHSAPADRILFGARKRGSISNRGDVRPAATSRPRHSLDMYLVARFPASTPVVGLCRARGIPSRRILANIRLSTLSMSRTIGASRIRWKTFQ